MTRAQDPAAAGHGLLRACHADRERVIDTLKTAFVHGRLTKDELDARAGRAFAARTHADLAALTVDIPPEPASRAEPPAAGSARPPVPHARGRRRPLVRAAVGSGISLTIAAAGVWAGITFDRPPDSPSWVPLLGFLILGAILAALGFIGYGVATWSEQRHSRRQLPPRPGPGGHALETGRHGGTGHGPVLPGPPRLPRRPDPRRPAGSQATAARSRLGGPGTGWREAGARRGLTPSTPPATGLLAWTRGGSGGRVGRSTA
jgi:hypothetical protein